MNSRNESMICQSPSEQFMRHSRPPWRHPRHGKQSPSTPGKLKCASPSSPRNFSSWNHGWMTAYHDLKLRLSVSHTSTVSVNLPAIHRGDERFLRHLDEGVGRHSRAFTPSDKKNNQYLLFTYEGQLMDVFWHITINRENEKCRDNKQLQIVILSHWHYVI